ncbi:MAG: hypothetical protein ABMA14_22645 [Hyphomonadaceae bacterium]
MESRVAIERAASALQGSYYGHAISAPNFLTWPMTVLDPTQLITELKAAICTTVDDGILFTIID